MIIDLATEAWQNNTPYDLCIVGAGAAGITVARQFVNSSVRVCLLESGGTDFDEATQELYAGPNIGMPYYDIVDARLRFFGGTTNIWGGRCIPMDAIDFERRSWVAHSGWPITRDDLNPYYRRAHAAMGLGEFEYSEQLWAGREKRPPAFDPQHLFTRFWRFDTTQEPFAATRCNDIIGAPNVDVVLHANVVHLQANEQANQLQHVVIQTLSKQQINIKADRYVLATGGIENARLLLISRDIEKSGIGNRNDHVGRYFMEHQHGRVGQVLTDDPWSIWHMFHKFPPQRRAYRCSHPALCAGSTGALWCTQQRVDLQAAT